MKLNLLLLGLGILGALCVGCANSPKGSREGQVQVFHATGEAFVEKADRHIGQPSVQWDSVLMATGSGLPSAGASTAGQKKLTALESARLCALAKLAETLKGIRVARSSRVRDMQFAGEEVTAELSADLSGVKVIEERYDEEAGVAEVTVQVGLDSQGNIIPERLLPITPLSVEARRARAAQAARLDAVAKLREQIGEVYVGQEVQVKNLRLSHQRAWLIVEGILEGVKFSEPKWPAVDHCTVEATLTLTPADRARLAGLVEQVPLKGSAQ